MAAGMPTSKIVEIEFGALGSNVWTDVSADVEWQDSLSITSRGRTSPYGTTQSATLTFTLDNSLGKYTPARQVLADGVTANPYYPNVVQRKRVRYSFVSGGTTYIRFVGFIKSWTPAMPGNILGQVVVTAEDRFGSILTRVTLTSPIRQAVLDAGPQACWTMTEPAGSASTVDVQGVLPSLAVTQVGAGGPLLFGDNGPGFGDGSGVKFAPASATAGQCLLGSMPGVAVQPSGFEIWVNMASTPATTRNMLSFDVPLGAQSGPLQLGVTASGFPTLTRVGDVTVTGTASIADGSWHLVTVIRTGTITLTWTIYVDGVSVASVTDSAPVPPDSYVSVTVGNSAPSQAAALFVGNLGYVTIFSPSMNAATTLANRAAARNGFAGDTTDARMRRWFTTAGLSAGDLNLDVGSTTVGTYPQSGTTIPQACQDMALTEGGGAPVYVAPDGRIRFANRHFRTSSTVAMTLDTVTDLDGSTFAGSQDDMSLVNESTGNRSTMSGTQTSQVVTDSTSVTANGLSSDGGFNSYAQADSDVLGSAQWRVATNKKPGYRLSQVSVDLASAETNQYAALTTVQIGSRIRHTSLPATVAPATQLDVLVEGWSETVDDVSYKIVFDTSPADNPAFGVYGPSTYGLYQADPGTTLNALISPSATTLAIATTGMTFTTVAGSYPFNIQIGQEVITLTSAPSGSTSPQTFTGVTRGVNGTPAAQQAAGSAVSVWPLATYGF